MAYADDEMQSDENTAQRGGDAEALVVELVAVERLAEQLALQLVAERLRELGNGVPGSG